MRSYGADVIARKNGYGPGEYPGDEKAVAAQAAAIEAGEAADLSVIYLYDCDRVGHRDGFGPQVDTYVEAVRVMAEERVRDLS